MILNPGLHWPRAGVEYPLSPVSLCLVCLCTCILNQCAGRASSRLLVPVCGVPLSVAPGGGPLSSGPVSCGWFPLVVICLGRRFTPGTEGSSERLVPFLQYHGFETNLLWASRIPWSLFVTRTHWPHRPRVTGSVPPCHTQVRVKKFQNKQKLYF